jgi:hypothetical protein
MSSLNVSGTTRLNSATTLLSSLKVSGTTTINGNLGVGTAATNGIDLRKEQVSKINTFIHIPKNSKNYAINDILQVL